MSSISEDNDVPKVMPASAAVRPSYMLDWWAQGKLGNIKIKQGFPVSMNDVLEIGTADGRLSDWNRAHLISLYSLMLHHLDLRVLHHLLCTARRASRLQL